jgi:hypothetical protein
MTSVCLEYLQMKAQGRGDRPLAPAVCERNQQGKFLSFPYEYRFLGCTDM